MFCKKCGKDIKDSQFCPFCGAEAYKTNNNVNNMNVMSRQDVINSQVKKKKSRVGLFICLVIIGALCFGISQIIQNPEKYQNQSENLSIVFDALKYEVKNGKNITEQELISQLGEPDSIEEWNFEVAGGKYYPIRTLYYGTSEYSFNNDNLQRITLYDKFSYESKDDFLPMFNLKKYANTDINDTNYYYRAYNCGVHDIWLEYSDGLITMTKITYGEIFGS